MSILDYIYPELTVVIVLLWVLGKMIKGTERIKDKYIPLILGAVGVVVATAYVIGGNDLSGGKAWLNAVLSGAVQGILCAGLAVYGNEIISQLRKKE